MSAAILLSDHSVWQTKPVGIDPAEFVRGRKPRTFRSLVSESVDMVIITENLMIKMRFELAQVYERGSAVSRKIEFFAIFS